MKNRCAVRIPLALFLLGVACRSANTPRIAPAGSPGTAALMLQGGTLINPGAAPVPNANIAVEHGRITCAGTVTACPRPAACPPVRLLLVAFHLQVRQNIGSRALAGLDRAVEISL